MQQNHLRSSGRSMSLCMAMRIRSFSTLTQNLKFSQTGCFEFSFLILTSNFSSFIFVFILQSQPRSFWVQLNQTMRTFCPTSHLRHQLARWLSKGYKSMPILRYCWLKMVWNICLAWKQAWSEISVSSLKTSLRPTEGFLFGIPSLCSISLARTR